MSIKEKKNQKVNFFSTLFIKKAMIKAKRLFINNFLNDLANIMSLVFF